MVDVLEELVNDYNKKLHKLSESESKEIKNEILSIAKDLGVDISHLFADPTKKSATPPKNDAQKSPTKRVSRAKRPASPKKEKTAPEPKKVEKKLYASRFKANPSIPKETMEKGKKAVEKLFDKKKKETKTLTKKEIKKQKILNEILIDKNGVELNPNVNNFTKIKHDDYGAWRGAWIYVYNDILNNPNRLKIFSVELHPFLKDSNVNFTSTIFGKKTSTLITNATAKKIQTQFDIAKNEYLEKKENLKKQSTPEPKKVGEKRTAPEPKKIDTSGIITFSEYLENSKGYGSEKLPKEFKILEYSVMMANRLCQDNNNIGSCNLAFGGLNNPNGSFREGITYAYNKKNRNSSLFRSLKSGALKILNIVKESGLPVDNFIEMVESAEYQEPKKVEKKKTAPKTKTISKSDIIVGNNGILETPSQEIPSKYVIMELDDVIQSHDERTFDWNPKYPRQCQERDYKKSAEKDKVLSYSSNFKPYHFINDSPEAMTGPSVISKDGIVLGGNGRIMMLKRVKLLNNYEKYIDYLKPRLQMFGFSDNAEFEKIKYPVLVRMIDAEMDRCTWYSRILNETLSRAKDQNTNSLSLAKSLSQKGFEEIAQIFEGEDDGTFNQVISKDKNQKIVIDVLRKNGIITSSNSPIWLTNDGNLTSAGKNNLENLLLAKILPSEELIEGAKDYTNRILKAIPVLTKIQTLSKEFDLLPYLRDVIKFENIRRTQGVSIKEFLNQESMFGNAEMPDNLVAMLWISLKSGVNKFRDILESYYVSARNSTQGDSMFGYDQEVTPESILSTLVANRGLSDRIKLSTRVVDSDVIKKGNEIHGFTGKDCKYYYVAGAKFNNGSISFLKTAMNNFSTYNRKHSDPQAKIYKFTNKNKANAKMKELLKNSGYFSNKSKNVQLTLANKPKRSYKKASGLSNKVVNHLKSAKNVATNKKLSFSQKLRKLLEY